MTFLYSAHSPIEDSDSCGILELANIYGVPRLITLCELYITKEVERATTDDIRKAEISVIDLLLLSQQQNANQLEKFCLHFISGRCCVDVTIGVGVEDEFEDDVDNDVDGEVEVVEVDC